MTRKFRRSLLVAMLLSMSFLLTGCIFDVSDVDLLAKPKLPLELEEISQVLQSHFNEDIQLITPLEGDNKKSVQFIDLDQDGENEVVVLHAKTDDQYAMKVTVLSKKDNKWRINTDIQGIGYDINKIAFPDLDGDGIREIVVGWQSGAQLNKGLSIFRHGANGYEEIYKDSFTEFVTGDINGDGKEELALVKLSRTEALAKAKVLSIKNGKVRLDAESYMDGFINEYAAMQVGQISKTRIGIIVDAKVGAKSGFTDVFEMKNGELRNLFFDSKWKVTRATYRQVSRQSQDINGDGLIEIPTLVRGNTHTKQSNLYVTVWHNINDQDQLTPVLKTFDDMENGIQFRYPANWQSNVGVVSMPQGYQFNWYDSTGKYHIPLLEITQIERNNWEATKEKYLQNGYFELGKNLDKIYLGKTFTSTEPEVIPLLVDQEMCLKLFKSL